MSLHILLVEDEPGLSLTISDLLTSEGYQVDTAMDGPERPEKGSQPRGRSDRSGRYVTGQERF